MEKSFTIQQKVSQFDVKIDRFQQKAKQSTTELPLHWKKFVSAAENRFSCFRTSWKDTADGLKPTVVRSTHTYVRAPVTTRASIDPKMVGPTKVHSARRTLFPSNGDDIATAKSAHTTNGKGAAYRWISPNAVFIILSATLLTIYGTVSCYCTAESVRCIIFHSYLQFAR